MKSPILNHPKQLEIFKHPARFKIAACGRRFGKSILGAEWLLHGLEFPRSRNIYTAPTREDAKDVVWDYIKTRLVQLKWKIKINESELKILRFKTNSYLQLKTAEVETKHRGRGINRIILDEFAEYKNKYLWHQAIRPSLSDTRGEAIFLLTPKGFNFAYDLFQGAKTDPEWACFQFKTLDSPFFQTDAGRAELEEAKRSLSEHDFKQEYEAEFMSYAGRIYTEFDREKVNTDYTYDPNNGPIYVGMDFNRSPMSACIFQSVAGTLIQFDEIFIKFSNTDEVCDILLDRYPKANFIICPDATGKRKTSNSSTSDFDIIKRHGYIIDSDSVNPRRIDRWAAVNRAYKLGLVKMNVSKCPNSCKDREVLCYKEGSCESDLKDPMSGHISDAGDYCIYRKFPLTVRRTQGAGYYA